MRKDILTLYVHVHVHTYLYCNCHMFIQHQTGEEDGSHMMPGTTRVRRQHSCETSFHGLCRVLFQGRRHYGQVSDIKNRPVLEVDVDDFIFDAARCAANLFDHLSSVPLLTIERRETVVPHRPRLPGWLARGDLGQQRLHVSGVGDGLE